MADGQHDSPSSSADDARRENEAMLDGFWCRAMEGLVEQGVPWNEAAASMLSVAALQVEAASGLEMVERSLDAARHYMRSKREASERLDTIASKSRPH